MTNELHLDEFRILDVKKDKDGSKLYLVEPDGEDTACINCGSVNTVRVLPSFGCPVALMISSNCLIQTTKTAAYLCDTRPFEV